MLSEEMEPAWDADHWEQSLRAQDLLRLFNSSSARDYEERRRLLRKLFGGCGDNPTVVPWFHCDYGWNIHVGKNFYMNSGGVILDCNRVTIGDNVMCGPHVQLLTATHPVDPKARLSDEMALPITIGNNVWLGAGAIVLPGVTIGDNVTIGAGSVVTRDIPPNVVAMGNPCRVARELDSEP